MSDIAPLNGPSAAAYSPSGRVDRSVTATPSPVSRGSDKLELSGTSRILAKLNDLPEVRLDLVGRIRAEIAEGTYETDDKIDAAVEGLAQDLV